MSIGDMTFDVQKHIFMAFEDKKCLLMSPVSMIHHLLAVKGVEKFIVNMILFIKKITYPSPYLEKQIL